MNIDYNAAEILSFSAKRDITDLFKDFLNIIEELQQDHNEALIKLGQTLPIEQQKQLYLADHFTKEKMLRIRKTILSKGNDTIRSVDQQIKQFDIKLKIVDSKPEIS